MMRCLVFSVFAVVPSAASPPTCCWSKWGGNSECGKYHGSGGLCNTDWTTHCVTINDCNGGPTPPTPPSPPTCCWSKWGGNSECGKYHGSGGLCNTDWTTHCVTINDCNGGPSLPTPPSPPTPSPPPQTPPGPIPPSDVPVDIIGYYGNAGNSVSMIPKISEVHENYNVIILTFAGISGAGEFSLDIQGPYEKNFGALAADLKAWKKTADKWNRKRLALVSIGGQNGNWPRGVSKDVLIAGLDKFMDEFDLDGLDIDLEGGSVGAASTLISVVEYLTGKGKVVTAAPEASQLPLNGYKDLIKHLSWVHPQFYNNPPNGVTTPWIPTDAAKWPTPWTVHDWQQEDGAGKGEAFWCGVLKSIQLKTGLAANQLGMLYPASQKAAGSQNNWNVGNLAKQVGKCGVAHVGNWALAYDREEGWKGAIALGMLNGASTVLV